jgi:zinc protease
VGRARTDRGVLQISFACAPANVERLRLILFAELGAVAEQGASDQLLAQVAEQLRRKHETDIKDNVWWAETLKDAYYFGDDVATITDIAAFTGRATSANVRATAHRILDKERYALIVVQPETTASAAAAPPNVLVPAAAPAGDAIESPP